MKINRFIIIGFFSFLFGINTIGQSNLVNITSQSREGHLDLTLNIIDTLKENDSWIITAKGQYQGIIVGFKIKLLDGIKPGLVNGRIDNTSWARNAVEISTIGEESDNFVRVFSELYSIKTEKPFSNIPVIFTCFSLNSETAWLKNGYFEFKLYFDDTNKSGLYTEIYINVNIPEGYIEMPDRDPEHIADFVKAMVR
jgi:hypothetical protein